MVEGLSGFLFPLHLFSEIMKTCSRLNMLPTTVLQIVLISLLLVFFSIPGFAQSASGGPGWYLTKYTFKDGSLQKESVLAGTTSRMRDEVSFKGSRGSIEISHNRHDVNTGKLLAGVAYQVKWSEPPQVLKAQEKNSFEFGRKTLSSLAWKPPQQSAHLNQGMSGVYFVAPDGAKFLTKDIMTTLTSEKVIDKGVNGAKRVLQMNFGNGFNASYEYEWRDEGTEPKPVASESAEVQGWVLTGYHFKDGSMEKESVLAGTSSRMKDEISFKGDKGNIEISQNRQDVKTGKLLAGVTYLVTWSEPPEVLKPQEKISFDFELKTLASLAWKPPQQSAHLNQGMSGVYFVSPNGDKYLNADIKAKLTTEKTIDTGAKGAKRVLQINFGNGFVASYSYEWR